MAGEVCEIDRGGWAKSLSYVAKTKGSLGFQPMNRNVLYVRIKKDPELPNKYVDDKVCEKVCEILEIDMKRDTIGFQIINVHPAVSREVSLVVLDLPCLTMWCRTMLSCSVASSPTRSLRCAKLEGASGPAR